MVAQESIEQDTRAGAAAGPVEGRRGAPGASLVPAGCARPDTFRPLSPEGIPAARTDERAGADPGPAAAAPPPPGGARRHRPAPRPQPGEREGALLPSLVLPLPACLPSACPCRNSPVRSIFSSCNVSPPMIAIVLLGSRSSSATLFPAVLQTGQREPLAVPRKAEGPHWIFFGSWGVCTSQTDFFSRSHFTSAALFAVPAELCQKR